MTTMNVEFSDEAAQAKAENLELTTTAKAIVQEAVSLYQEWLEEQDEEDRGARGHNEEYDLRVSVADRCLVTAIEAVTDNSVLPDEIMMRLAALCIRAIGEDTE